MPDLFSTITPAPITPPVAYPMARPYTSMSIPMASPTPIPISPQPMYFFSPPRSYQTQQPPQHQPQRQQNKANEEGSSDDDEEEDIDEEQLENPGKKEHAASLVKEFTQEQMNRHESYKRSAFQKSSIKRYMTSVSGAKINQNTVIVMAGITKIFLGEVVETAKEVMEEWGDTGAIKPAHIREAYQRMKLQGKIPYTRYKRHLFKNHL